MSKQFKARQGDVFILPVNVIPEKAKVVENGVVAYGEVTGHRHQCINGTVLADEQGNLFLRATEGTELRHLDTTDTEADHKAVPVAPGDYKIVIQEEYQPEGWKQVID